MSFIVDAPLGSKYATAQRQPFSGVLEKSYYERFCKFYRKTFTMKTCLVNLLALASKFIIKESIAGLEWLFSEQLVLNNTSKQQLQYQPFSLYQIPGADVFMVQLQIYCEVSWENVSKIENKYDKSVFSCKISGICSP